MLGCIDSPRIDSAPALEMAVMATENPSAKHSLIVSAIERRDYDTAEKQLQAFKRTHPNEFRINNYEYLLGRVYDARTDLALAKKSYELVLEQNSILSEYAHWRLAVIARQEKDLSKERKHLKSIIDSYPESLLKNQATLRLAESYLESNDAASALPLFRTRANYSSSSGREAMGKVALAYLKLGRVEEARPIFERLLSGSRDDQALFAAEKLDELDAKRTLSEVDLLTRARVYLYNRDSNRARSSYQKLVELYPKSKSISEALYSIGRSYYIEYDYENAVKWYERAYEVAPSSDQGQMGFYQAGHAYQNMGKYTEAVRRYNDLIEQYPKSEWIRGAHLNTIDSLRSQGKYDEAIEWSDRTVSRFGQDVAANTALFNKAKIYLIKNNYTLAFETFTILRGRNLSQRGPGATNRAEVDFMRGFCLEKMGRIAEAVDVYLDFPVNRDSYYSNRATMRLQDLSEDAKAKNIIAARFKSYAEIARGQVKAGNFESAKAAANQALRLTTNNKAKDELIDILKQCYSNLSAYNQFFGFEPEAVGRGFISERSKIARERSHKALADELAFLGLYDEGAPELRASLSRDEIGSVTEDSQIAHDQIDADMETENLVDVSSRGRKGRVIGKKNVGKKAVSTVAPSWQYSLAVYLNRGSHAHQAIKYGESKFGNVPDDYRLEILPRDIAELLYPAPYRDEMVREGQSKGVDARFMLAIARQESRFNYSAKSAAAARGMFQFISSTADRISNSLKLKEFNQDELYEPPVAIRFAAQYMGELFAEFKENPYAVAASYNGGEQAVRRWVERTRSDDFDRFVIEVAYQESKDYVYKVMCNYWAYTQLYKPDLNED